MALMWAALKSPEAALPGESALGPAPGAQQVPGPKPNGSPGHHSTVQGWWGRPHTLPQPPAAGAATLPQSHTPEAATRAARTSSSRRMVKLVASREGRNARGGAMWAVGTGSPLCGGAPSAGMGWG